MHYKDAQNRVIDPHLINLIFFSGILVSPNLTNSVNENFNELMGHWLMLDVSASDPTVILEAAHQFYFGNKNVSRETERNLTNLITGK